MKTQKKTVKKAPKKTILLQDIATIKPGKDRSLLITAPASTIEDLKLIIETNFLDHTQVEVEIG